MLRKFLVGALCTLALVACGKSIEGLLTNTEALTFNIKNKTTTIQPGQWPTLIKFSSKTEVKLIVAVPKESKREISFKVPKGSPLPKENGTFELLSEVSGQPYDVQGSVSTTYKDSLEQAQWESCSYQQQRQECYYNGNQTVCHWVPYTVYGNRDVRFFIRDTTQEVNFNLIKTDKSKTPGTFKGVEQYSERFYTYQGVCR